MKQPQLKFDPRTIEHLGPKLYSKLPDAIAELVANAYDADAKAAIVTIRTDGAGRESIKVTDDGHGMTPKEINNDYLRIGRDRRADLGELSRSGTRQVSGKKGLGKLALFGIGHRITLRTHSDDDPRHTTLELVWSDILAETSGKYRPRVHFDDKYDGGHGTDITVSELQRRTEISPEDLARSLSKLFTLTDSSFELFVERTDGTRIPVDAALRKEAYALEKTYRVPDDLPVDRFPALRELGIQGWIGFSETTLRSDLRGVTLHSKGRRASTPSFFDAQASNFAYAYIVGELTADYLDGLKPDVISTARSAINWDHPDTVTFRKELSELAIYVANERRRLKAEANERKIREVAGIDRARWLGTLPPDARTAVANILETVVDPDNEYKAGDQQKIIQGVYSVAPEYAELHWRHLDPLLKTAKMEDAYKDGRWDDALEAALHPLYLEIKKRLPHLSTEPNESGLFTKAFSTNLVPRLEVVDLENSHSSFGFSNDTVRSFQVGTQNLAIGVISGFRNPISHSSGPTLFDAKILEKADCLDGLSALSHVARMIQRARVVTV